MRENNQIALSPGQIEIINKYPEKPEIFETVDKHGVLTQATQAFVSRNEENKIVLAYEIVSLMPQQESGGPIV